MTIDRRRLRRIIKEELDREMVEMSDDDTEVAFEVEDDMDTASQPMVNPPTDEIDWTQFDDEDAEVVGSAFMEALKQLREEMPGEEPPAESVVSRMQLLLKPEVTDDVSESDDERLNEWINRTNLLAGTRRR